jgi:hypothetical protein
MSKLTLNNVPSLVTAPGVINTNNERIEDEFDKVLYRDGTAPNAMLSPLDMNGYRIVNLPPPVNNSDAARKVDVDQIPFNVTAAEEAARAAQEAAETAQSGAESTLTGALAAKDLAERWATDPEDSVVENGEFSSFHYSQKSAGSAAAAFNYAALLQSPDYGFIADVPTDTADYGSLTP